MTNEQKAMLYDALVREGDALNREKSRIKAENAGINMSPENEKKVIEIDRRLNVLENRLTELLR